MRRFTTGSAEFLLDLKIYPFIYSGNRSLVRPFPDPNVGVVCRAGGSPPGLALSIDETHASSYYGILSPIAGARIGNFACAALIDYP